MAPLPKDALVAIAGAGQMGGGIAQVAAAAGHHVLLWDVASGAAETAKEKVRQDLTRRVEKGKLEASERDAILARIRPCESFGELREATLVVEAIVESLEAKQTLFRELESIVSGTAILATNTSSLSVTAIASALEHPERCAGWHFFNPAAIMPLVEVVSGLRTGSEVVVTLVDTAEAWGKSAVHARSAPGFIVNKGARPFYGEPLRFAEEGGADFTTIDALLKAAGFRMGPFELIDLVGLDVNLSVSEGMWAANFGEDRYRPSPLVAERVSAGFMGRKSGQGFYTYPATAEALSQVMPAGPRPERVAVHGGLGPARDLIPVIQAAGIEIETAQGDGWLDIDGTRLVLTDGRMASGRGVVLFDLALDWAQTRHIAITTAKGSGSEDAMRAAGLFQALEMAVSFVEDLPGMLVARTIVMLVNEACDTVLRGTAAVADVDLAMQNGLNFPGGPFQWVDSLTAAYCETVLDNMAWSYGEDRYRASVLLRRHSLTGAKFHA